MELWLNFVIKPATNAFIVENGRLEENVDDIVAIWKKRAFDVLVPPGVDVR